MGRNNRDYKLKDKKLTTSKKNAKLNKSIAFALAGMTTLSIGSTFVGPKKEIRAKSSYETLDKTNSFKKLSSSKIVKTSKDKTTNLSRENLKFK